MLVLNMARLMYNNPGLGFKFVLFSSFYKSLPITNEYVVTIKL